MCDSAGFHSSPAGDCWYFHCPDKKLEAQKGETTCPKSRDEQVAELGFEPTLILECILIPSSTPSL